MHCHFWASLGAMRERFKASAPCCTPPADGLRTADEVVSGGQHGPGQEHRLRSVAGRALFKGCCLRRYDR